MKFWLSYIGYMMSAIQSCMRVMKSFVKVSHNVELITVYSILFQVELLLLLY